MGGRPGLVVALVLLVTLGPVTVPVGHARTFPRTLEVTAASDAAVFQYTIRVDGDAVLGREADPDTGDSVTRNPDGTVTITGTAGRGGTDTYRISGRVVCGSLGGPGTVRVEGTARRLPPCRRGV